MTTSMPESGPCLIRFEQLDAVEVGHFQVGDDDVEGSVLQLLPGLPAVGGGDDFVALARRSSARVTRLIFSSSTMRIFMAAVLRLLGESSGPQQPVVFRVHPNPEPDQLFGTPYGERSIAFPYTY